VKTPSELRYTEDHEWLRPEGKSGRVGITDFAQDQLGDVVFVELPEVGRAVKQGEAFGVVESVKSVSDVFAPITGKVVAVNQALVDTPELVNQDPYGQGWIVEIEIADDGEVQALLDAQAYGALQEGGH
jgi:glycine cleavage system H protein